MEGLKPPKCLSFDGNVSEHWKKWIQQFQILHIASGNDKKDVNVQIAIFFNVIGKEALEKYNTFDLSFDDKGNLIKVIEVFESYCTPKSNESVDRHIFFTRIQQISESFNEFLTSLKKLSSTCGFGDLKDSLIRDRIISSVIDKKLKDHLLRENDLSLDKCVNICKPNELAEVQLKSLNGDTRVDVIKSHKNNFAGNSFPNPKHPSIRK